MSLYISITVAYSLSDMFVPVHFCSMYSDLVGVREIFNYTGVKSHFHFIPHGQAASVQLELARI